MTEDPRDGQEKGPVPVRHLMRQLAGEPEAEREPEPERDGPERGFRIDDEEWVVRPAGEGLYGTGRTGTARLLAIHFYRSADPETPVREALVPAGVFPDLRPEELRELFERATPIQAG